MPGHLKKFEQLVIFSLIGLLSIVVFLSTIELAWILLRNVLSPPVFLLDIAELLDLFGFFLLILIGLELIESTRAYLQGGIVHTEIVLAVAIIAVARKVIILETQDLQGIKLIGIGFIILGLAAAYFLVKRARCEK